MTIKEVREDFPFPTGIDRSPGLHVSEIIQRIYTDLYAKRASGDINDPDVRLRLEMGFMWEEMLSAAYKYRMGIRPGEIDMDGVAMSPDGINVSGNRLVLEEYKATWKSSRNTPIDIPTWTMQTKAYCKAVETTRVVYRVFYVNGDYKGGYQPQYKVYRVQYSQYELDENWDMLLNQAVYYGLLR